MFARRRPLARAAVVGGAAYYGGKKHAEHQAAEAEQQAQIDDQQAQQEYEAAPAAAPAVDPMERLKELGSLHEQGILTDAEFEIEKQKILQQM